jgi:hypothetical protein
MMQSSAESDSWIEEKTLNPHEGTGKRGDKITQAGEFARIA